MTTITPILATAITRYVVEHDATAAKLAAVLGVHEVTVSNWRRGVRVPSRARVRSMADLGVLTKGEARRINAARDRAAEGR